MLFINSYIAYTQQAVSVDKWMEYVDEWADQSDNMSQAQTLFDDLSYLVEHPININTASIKQFNELPFLSDIQIEGILKYIKRYGAMISMYELKDVDGLDMQTIELLIPFIYFGKIEDIYSKPTLNNLLKYGKHELALSYNQCFQQKEGYKPLPVDNTSTSLNKRYEGEPFYHALRYGYSFKDKIQAGFVAEKDAGEPFLKPIHKGYDSYSAHLLYKDTGWIRTLALGDYKASFGQGLVFSQSFSLSRSMILTQGDKRTNGFRRHYSTNEYDFLRGAAVTLGHKALEWSAFYSHRVLDATLIDEDIRSIKTDGLHRTLGERNKLKRAIMQTYGTNIRYALPNLRVGFTAVAYSLGDMRINPPPQPYNLYYFRGSSNYNMGVDYLFKWNNLTLYGETAYAQNGALATLNALRLSPRSYLSFLIMQRSYSKKYQAFYGNAFGQQSSGQNEEGVYMGMEVSPFAQWKVSIYADVYRFPWIRYGAQSPTTGQEYQVQTTYTKSRNLSFQLRYRYKESHKSNQQRMRLQSNYLINNCWVFKTSLDGVDYSTKVDQNLGVMLSQSVGYKPTTVPFQLDFFGGYFNTDNYFSRITSYEKNILYTYSFASFYGEGVRLACSLRYTWREQLSFYLKLAHTTYADRSEIGSALETIQGRNKTDFYGLLRWKF
jgi:hypothetical protein